MSTTSTSAFTTQKTTLTDITTTTFETTTDTTTEKSTSTSMINTTRSVANFTVSTEPKILVSEFTSDNVSYMKYYYIAIAFVCAILLFVTIVGVVRIKRRCWSTKHRRETSEILAGSNEIFMRPVPKQSHLIDIVEHSNNNNDQLQNVCSTDKSVDLENNNSESIYDRPLKVIKVKPVLNELSNQQVFTNSDCIIQLNRLRSKAERNIDINSRNDMEILMGEILKLYLEDPDKYPPVKYWHRFQQCYPGYGLTSTQFDAIAKKVNDLPAHQYYNVAGEERIHFDANRRTCNVLLVDDDAQCSKSPDNIYDLYARVNKRSKQTKSTDDKISENGPESTSDTNTVRSPTISVGEMYSIDLTDDDEISENGPESTSDTNTVRSPTISVGEMHNIDLADDKPSTSNTMVTPENTSILNTSTTNTSVEVGFCEQILIIIRSILRCLRRKRERHIEHRTNINLEVFGPNPQQYGYDPYETTTFDIPPTPLSSTIKNRLTNIIHTDESTRRKMVSTSLPILSSHQTTEITNKVDDPRIAPNIIQVQPFIDEQIYENIN